MKLNKKKEKELKYLAIETMTNVATEREKQFYMQGIDINA